MTAGPTTPTWSPESLLSQPLIRLALLVPPLATVAVVLLVGEVVAPGLFAIHALMALGLAVSAASQPDLPFLPQHIDRPVFWGVVAAFAGPLLVAATLLWAVEIDVRLFAPVFALILLVSAFVAPRQLRGALTAWIVTVWVCLMVYGGERDVTVLLVHLGGGLALAATTNRAELALTDSYAQAAAARQEAERRVELMAALLRTHDLDPAVVLRSVTDGLIGVGFDLVAIREVDRTAWVARLVEGAARGEQAVAAELSLDLPGFRQVLMTGGPVFRVRSADGSDPLDAVGMVGVAIFPVMEDGEVVALVAGATADAPPTDGAIAAAELLVAQAGEALRRAHAFRMDRATTEQLQAVDHRTQEFLSTVSHELRTPLTVVQGLSATLAERWEDLDPARRGDLLRRIDANTERLAAMVTRLLNTSQLSRRGLEVAVGRAGLAVLVRSSLDRLDEVLVAHPVHLDVDDAVEVMVDGALFSHVIDNLLVNVTTHTPVGTTTWVRSVRVGDRVRVEVVDDGPGIAATDLPHLFDRFYRGGDDTHRISTRGLGLGLALAAEVVRAHGGRLEAGTAAEGGARFTFDVAAAPPRS